MMDLIRLTLILVICVICFVKQNGVSAQNDEQDSEVKILYKRIFKAPRIFDFKTYKMRFNKHYSGVEEINRTKLYLASAFESMLSSIKYLIGKTSYFSGINQFSDWTDKERLSLLPINSVVDRENVSVAQEAEVEDKLTEIERAAAELIEIRPEIVEDKDATAYHKMRPDGNYNSSYAQSAGSKALFKKVKKSLGFGKAKITRGVLKIDHRDCLVPPKEQKSCGNCFVFSSIALYEWMFCKQYGVQVDLSEQYVVDCAKMMKNEDYCVHGMEEGVVDIVEKFGVELAEDYPRKKKQRSPLEKGQDIKAMGQFRLDKPQFGILSEDVMMKEALGRSPLAITLGIGTKFFAYQGGVFPGECNRMSKPHSMVIVGMGVEDNMDYWLARNSWSRAWGEGGYVKLSKLTRCLHRDLVLYPAAIDDMAYSFNMNPDHEKYKDSKNSR